MMIGGAWRLWPLRALINLFGWRWTFVVFGLIGLVWAAAFYLWFRDDPAEHPGTNRPSGTDHERPADQAVLDPDAPEALAADVHATISRPTGRSPGSWSLGNANVWLLGGAMMTMSAIYYMLISWYPTYLQEARGATPNASSWLATMVLGAGAFGCFFGGWLTDWLVQTTGNRRWGRTAQSVVGARHCRHGHPDQPVHRQSRFWPRSSSPSPASACSSRFPPGGPAPPRSAAGIVGALFG